jgi:uncharacterized protein YdaT
MITVDSSIVSLSDSVAQAVSMGSLLGGFMLGGAAASWLVWQKVKQVRAAHEAEARKVQVQFQMISVLENELSLKQKLIAELEEDSLDRVLKRADEAVAQHDFAGEVAVLLGWWRRNRPALAAYAGRFGDRWLGFSHLGPAPLNEAATLFRLAATIEPQSRHFQEASRAAEAALDGIPERDDAASCDPAEIEARESDPRVAAQVFAQLEAETERLIERRQYLLAFKLATRAGRILELGPADTPGTLRARAMWLWARAATYAGELPDALAIAEEAWQLRKRMLPVSHEDTMASAILVAQILVKLGRFEKALPIAKSVWETRQRTLSADHLDTLAAASLVSQITARLGVSRGADDSETPEKKRSKLRIVTSDAAKPAPGKAKTTKRRRRKAETPATAARPRVVNG